MAVPKQRTSRRRRDQRRATHGIPTPRPMECPQCHSPKRPHRVCAVCGHYDDREVIAQPDPFAEGSGQDES